MAIVSSKTIFNAWNIVCAKISVWNGFWYVLKTYLFKSEEWRSVFLLFCIYFSTDVLQYLLGLKCFYFPMCISMENFDHFIFTAGSNNVKHKECSLFRVAVQINNPKPMFYKPWYWVEHEKWRRRQQCTLSYYDMESCACCYIPEQTQAKLTELPWYKGGVNIQFSRWLLDWAFFWGFDEQSDWLR